MFFVMNYYDGSQALILYICTVKKAIKKIMYEALKLLDPIRINFSAAGMHIINIILSFIMFGVALGIKPNQFKELIKEPKPYLIGLFGHLFALPLMTFLLVVALNNYITP